MPWVVNNLTYKCACKLCWKYAYN